MYAAQERFAKMLPRIQRDAHFFFRMQAPKAQAESVASAVAWAWQMYVRLIDREQEALAYPAPLAMYGCKRVRSQRSVGSAFASHELLAQWGGIDVETLHSLAEFDATEETHLIDEKALRPDDLAASRIDYSAWMDSLPAHDRRLAELLASGTSTDAAAIHLRVSNGRISQLRRVLERSSRAFIGADGSVATERGAA